MRLFVFLVELIPIKKCMNQGIFLAALGKYLGRFNSFTVICQKVLKKEHSKCKLVKHRLKFDLVSYSARVDDLSK